jgi:hypothetical protein
MEEIRRPINWTGHSAGADRPNQQGGYNLLDLATILVATLTFTRQDIP